VKQEFWTGLQDWWQGGGMDLILDVPMTLTDHPCWQLLSWDSQQDSAVAGDHNLHLQQV
jgi:hypothetical protein